MFDERSEKNIATLAADAQPWARAWLQAAIDYVKTVNPNLTVKIISGNRTYAEQNKLYAQGRTLPGSIVTNARGGQSNHNFAIAWDIGIFKNGQYLSEHSLYGTLGTVLCKQFPELEWGGNWHFQDKPHWNIKTGKSISQLRALMPNIPIPKYTDRQSDAPIHVVDNTKVCKVYDNGKEVVLNPPAQLIDSRVWVPIRDFCNHFGGEILRVGEGATQGDAAFTVALNDKKATMSGVLISGKGYVPFKSLLELQTWEYDYENGALKITTAS